MIAHLDIKPDNIMATPEGVLKIADFGLAMTLKGKNDLVTDGLYRGTEEYMAPEVDASNSECKKRIHTFEQCTNLSSCTKYGLVLLNHFLSSSSL